jgi:indoleamine 2,3-dioxygenase
MVLAWLLHFYVHSSTSGLDSASISIPRGLAVPIVKVSQVLRIAPVLTFADTVLWNVEPINPNLPLSMENFQVVNCFSGTEDERNFYKTSAQVEMRGLEALSIIHRYINLSDPADYQNNGFIAGDLTRLARIIEDISEIMQTVREGVDPKIFYWAVRPWFKGSDADGPTSSSWIFEGVTDADVLDLSGPSAGQSSVMHALDIFLDINHKMDHTQCPIASVRKRQPKDSDPGFMQRMRRYMPGAHRDFLNHIAEAPVSVRELAEKTVALQKPYNSAIGALKKLRDTHIRIACLYIISMANSRPPPGFIVRTRPSDCETRGPALGTGGNEVANLLKAGRDATRRALIQ